jgi:hypothetical protein
VPEAWRRFFRRAAIALGLLIVVNLVVFIFPWTPASFTYWQVPASCVIFICFLGVLIFDTFF